MKGMSAYDGNGAYCPSTSSYAAQITEAPAQVRQPRPTQLQPSRQGLDLRPADQQLAAAIAGATMKARSLTTSRVCSAAWLMASQQPNAASATRIPPSMVNARRGEAMVFPSAHPWCGCTTRHENDQTGLGGLWHSDPWPARAMRD